MWILRKFLANAIHLPVHNRNMHSPTMNVRDVQALVRLQSSENLSAVNDHRISLKDALVEPRTISVIARQVINGRTSDELSTVWLVGQENGPEGYQIILRGDGSQFGLASKGFPDDKAPILVGWYGDLLTAFLGM
jgi:hypothetical protein